MPVKKVDNFRKAIEAIEEGAADGLERAAEAELEEIEQGFEQGRDARGKPWKQLSDSTIRNKGHGRILIDSGDLSESGYVRRSRTGGGVKLGLADPKAPIHEYGTATIPRRPILRPAMVDLEESMQGIVGDAIARELRSAGFALDRSLRSKL